MYGDPELMESYGDFEDDLEAFADFEDDLEGFDFEDDYEDMDYEDDWEDDLEGLMEDDYEGDQFLGGLVRGATRVARRLPWRRLLRSGASTLLSNLEDEPETLAEMAYLAELAADTESTAEADQFLGAIGSLAGSLLPKLLGSLEAESYEDEWESEFVDEEGDEFLPALLPIVSSILPAAMPLIKRGVKAIGKALREADPSKQSVKVLPIVAAKTVASLARQAKTGKKITPKRVNATLVRQTKKTLASPRKVAKAIANNRKAAKRAAQVARRNTRVTKQVLRRKRLMRAR